MDMPTPSADTTDQASPADETSQASGGYTICIDCQPDGSFEVYKEDAQEEAAEPPGHAEDTEAPAGEPQHQRVDSLEEALKQVIRIHRENPMDQSYSAHMAAGFQGEHQTPY
jgi:hypothetical protein